MVSAEDTTALVALLRATRRPWSQIALEVAATGCSVPLLEEERGLLAGEAVRAAAAEVELWGRRGIRPISLLDDDYPANLAALPDRPPLLFVAGDLSSDDVRAVAVVGARQASPRGVRAATAIARRLVDGGYTVVSGLAAGIDAAAHTAALDARGRTVAVIGSGLDRCYPPQHMHLQREIARRAAVISQFWPELPPSRRTFPMRNAVMSGMTVATVIVEASATSGTRIQARTALAQGRAVLLLASLMDQEWAIELAAQPGVHVVRTLREIVEHIEHAARSVTVGVG